MYDADILSSTELTNIVTDEMHEHTHEQGFGHEGLATNALEEHSSTPSLMLTSIAQDITSQ